MSSYPSDDLERVEQWVRGCFKKKQHSSKQAAYAHISNLERAGKKMGDQHPYKCDFCPWWHIGRRRGYGHAGAAHAGGRK